MAIKYYNIFKQLKEEGQHDLNVSTIFTYAANEDKKKQVNHVHSKEALQHIILDYNQTFGKTIHSILLMASSMTFLNASKEVTLPNV